MTSLSDIYRRLYRHFGHRNWWPGDSRLEICIGAVLTQNTNWGNVEKAISNLKAEGLIDRDRLLSLSTDRLAELIRPAGYYNVKAGRLRNLLIFLSGHGGNDGKNFEALGDAEFREKLLEVNGVGRETADSILLYAFERPFFVIDAYTRRIFSRLGFSDPKAGYEELQGMFIAVDSRRCGFVQRLPCPDRRSRASFLPPPNHFAWNARCNPSAREKRLTTETLRADTEGKKEKHGQ